MLKTKGIDFKEIFKAAIKYGYGITFGKMVDYKHIVYNAFLPLCVRLDTDVHNPMLAVAVLAPTMHLDCDDMAKNKISKSHQGVIVTAVYAIDYG